MLRVAAEGWRRPYAGGCAALIDQTVLVAAGIARLMVDKLLERRAAAARSAVHDVQLVVG